MTLVELLEQHEDDVNGKYARRSWKDGVILTVEDGQVKWPDNECTISDLVDANDWEKI